MPVLGIDVAIPGNIAFLGSWEQYESVVFQVSPFLNSCMS